MFAPRTRVEGFKTPARNTTGRKRRNGWIRKRFMGSPSLRHRFIDQDGGDLSPPEEKVDLAPPDDLDGGSLHPRSVLDGDALDVVASPPEVEVVAGYRLHEPPYAFQVTADPETCRRENRRQENDKEKTGSCARRAFSLVFPVPPCPPFSF